MLSLFQIVWKDSSLILPIRYVELIQHKKTFPSISMYVFSTNQSQIPILVFENFRAIKLN